MKYKPIDFQPAKFDLTGGVDTKVSGLVLPPPKLQVCENAWVDQTGALQRRYGRTWAGSTVTDGTTMPDPVALARYQDKLIALTPGSSAKGGAAYEYASALGRWTAKDATAGGTESPRVRQENVAKSGGEGGAWAGDSATANGITLHAYEEHETSGANIKSSVKITITDVNGSVLKNGHQLFTVTAAASTDIFGVKCAVRGNFLYAFYYDVTAADLMVAIVDTTSAATLGTMSPTAVSVATDIDTTTPFFDVCANTTHGIFVAYLSTTANTIKFGFVSSAGALSGTSTTLAGAAPGPIAVDVSPGLTMHAIVYGTGVTPSDVFACHRSWSGSAWTATATSTALDTGLTAAVNSIACKYESGASTSLRVYYGSGTTTFPTVSQATYSTAGVIAAGLATLRHSMLTSKIALGADLLQYYWVTYNLTLTNLTGRPAMYLMRSDGVPIARALVGTAAYPQRVAYALPLLQGSATMTTTGAYYWDVAESVVDFTSSIALSRLSVEFTHDASHATVEDSSELYMAGAIPQQYDGAGFVEAGFLNYPNINKVSGVQSTGGGTRLTVTSIYAYRFVYEWTNIRGKLEQSTDNGPLTMAVLTGTNNTWTLAIPTLSHTRKQSPRGDVVIGVYRTLADPDENAPHYRVGQVTNDPTANTVSFVDSMSDVTAAVQEQLYLDSGEVDNVSPPPAHIIASGNGRVFLAGMGDGGEVWYSKVRFPGQALAFSDLNTLQFPTTFGPITALATMNGILVAFTERAIYYCTGQGPNNTGFGEFSPPELVSADTGTAYPRSVCTTPMGVFFEGVKGKMLLTDGLRLSYIGAQLEKLASSGAPTGTCMVPALQQVRFSYATVTHVYDYYHTQWYVFTHGSEGPTVMWNDVHVGLVAGVVYDNPANWDDAGTDYTMEITLGWMGSPQTRRANVAIRSLGLTGESLAAHYLTIYVAYDQGTPAMLVEETYAAAGILDPLWRVSQQVCSTIEVTIRDALLNVYGADVVQATAGMKLNELVFEIGTRNALIGREV